MIELSISMLQVDVFAYGMTLYEIISLQAPFHKQEGMKRNHEVRAGKRPPTGNKVSLC